MGCVVFVPARYASTRYPGKPLVDLKGATGESRSLIRRSWDEGALERDEGLEQLRFLENSVPVTCVPVEGRGRVFWELNNPVDVARIEAVLKMEGIA